MRETDPEGWANDSRPAMPDETDIVVYETHIRDFTMSPHSGVEHKGKFLGMAECADYLSELGVTHVQILPFFDYGSIDETKLAKNRYNWGYDPVNYNAPEGG
jgi:pullulanase